MGFIWGCILSIVSALIAGKLVSGIIIGNLRAAVLLSLVVGLGGYALHSVLMFFLAPFNWITLGVLGLIIGVLSKAFVVRYMDKKIEGFEANSFSSAFIYCILVSVAQYFIPKIISMISFFF